MAHCETESMASDVDSSSIDRLRKWGLAASILSDSRRFRYTLDLEKEEEKKNLLTKIRKHAQVLRAALRIKKWLPQRDCPRHVVAPPDGYAAGGTPDARRAAAPDDDGGPISAGDTSSCLRGATNSAADGILASGTSSSGGCVANCGGGVATANGSGGNAGGRGGIGGAGANGGSNGGGGSGSSVGTNGGDTGRDPSSCSTAGGGTGTGAGSGGTVCGANGSSAGDGATGGHGVGSCVGTINGGATTIVSGNGGANGPRTSISVGGFHPKPFRNSRELVQGVLFLLGMGGAGGIGAMQVVDTQKSISLKILLLGINISFGGCILSAFVGLIALVILYFRPLPRLPYLLTPTRPPTCRPNYSHCKGILTISCIVSSIFMLLAIIMVVCFNIGRQI